MNKGISFPRIIDPLGRGLPTKAQKRLRSSWAETFYQELFCRIDESAFSVLYSEKKSRPNIPVNVLVGLDTLKSAYGWSDEELYDNCLFDLQVRYALGSRELDEGCFDLRTLYNFRASVVEYEPEHGMNGRCGPQSPTRGGLVSIHANRRRFGSESVISAASYACLSALPALAAAGSWRIESGRLS